MQAIRNIKTFSAIAALALTASMPFASHAGRYVRDMSNASHEGSEQTGIQSITELSVPGPQAPRVPYQRDMSNVSREGSEQTGVQSVADITPKGPQAPRVAYVRDMSNASHEGSEQTGIQSVKDLTTQSTTFAQAPDGFHRNAAAATGD